MTTRHVLRVFPLVLAPLAFVAAMAAQQARDGQATSRAPAGTASIAGRVMTAEPDARPLAAVIVALAGDDLPSGRGAITDGDGRFVFERLPAGRYTVTGTKPAYVRGGYGVTRPGRSTIPIQLRTGEARTGVTFTMVKGAVITGALRDPNGDPVPDMSVAVFRLPPAGAPPVLVLAQSATSDDRGVYRVFGLAPGAYLVSSLLRASSRASDVSAPTTAQVDDALLALQRGAPGVSARTAMEPPGTYAWTPVFYPGTPSPDAAARISVGIGEERAGVDFIVQLTRMARIEGEIIDGGNQVAPPIINTAGYDLPSLLGSAPTFSWQQTPTGRHFTYTNVAPGRYVITAQAQNGASWAKSDVEVTGADVGGLTLVMRPGLHLSGRVVFEPGTLPPPDPRGIDMRLVGPRGAFSSTVGTTRMGQAIIPPAVIGADGAFDIGGLIPDTYRLRITLPGPPGWALRSAMIGGVDMLDRDFDLGSSDVSGAVLTFSDRQASLSGTILNAADQGLPAYFIAVFPVDRSLWRPQARRIQSARSGTDGSWIVKGLPAGDYLVAALTDLSPEDLADPAFLSELAGSSIKVSLADGEQKIQPLRIAGR